MFVSVAVAAYIYGTIQQPLTLPSYLRGSVSVMGQSFGVYRLFLIATSLAVTVVLVAALEYTRFGAQVRAAVDNQRMARGLGIDVDRVRHRLGRSAAGSRSRRRASSTREVVGSTTIRSPIWSTC